MKEKEEEKGKRGIYVSPSNGRQGVARLILSPSVYVAALSLFDRVTNRSDSFTNDTRLCGILRGENEGNVGPIRGEYSLRIITRPTVIGFASEKREHARLH